MSNENQPQGLNDVVANELITACAAAQRLAEQGIKVFAAMANGRQPLLMCDRMPEGVVSGLKSRYPNGRGGMTLVHAAVFAGCRLECMRDVYSESQAAAVRAAPRLEVVRG